MPAHSPSYVVDAILTTAKSSGAQFKCRNIADRFNSNNVIQIIQDISILAFKTNFFSPLRENLYGTIRTRSRTHSAATNRLLTKKKGIPQVLSQSIFSIDVIHIVKS